MFLPRLRLFVSAFTLNRKEVRQFHMEQKGNVLHREPDWSLGKAGQTVTIREKHVGDTTAEAKTRRITKVNPLLHHHSSSNSTHAIL